ncbi:hypothetical protein NDU88_002635 [Pleurodeles waltl]|uniref:Uncharacterized protein n=1 Tax=Pleurodeles waltl TaxID=8319 RepID=A0AAV7M4R1_PLEWA|nr:hypothetical protein NDU88_002635 [Pleurodeles waltl]
MEGPLSSLLAPVPRSPELLGRAPLPLWQLEPRSCSRPAPTAVGSPSRSSRSLCRTIRLRHCRLMNLGPASFWFSLHSSHSLSAILRSGGREHSVSQRRAEGSNLLCCSPLGGVAGPQVRWCR